MMNDMTDKNLQLSAESRAATRELPGVSYDEPLPGRTTEGVARREGGSPEDNAAPGDKMEGLPSPNPENAALRQLSSERGLPALAATGPMAEASSGNEMMDPTLRAGRERSRGTRLSALNNNRPLIVIDVETTGLRPGRDQIIECAIQMGLNDQEQPFIQRFKPTVPISPEAQAKHGISLDDLQDCPAFADHAGGVRQILAAAQIIVGYNVYFDLEMFQAKFRRAGVEPIGLSQRLIIDAYGLWQRCETRTLQDAHRRFVGEPYEGEHSAEADMRATSRVLLGMLDAFGLTRKTWDTLAHVCEPTRHRWIGPSRHFQWEAGVPIFGFGKHAGAPLSEVASGPDSGYLAWMTRNDFPEHVRAICDAATKHDATDLRDWIVKCFGPPPEGEIEHPAG